MATLLRTQAIVHYAEYQGLYGQARLVPGGYAFTADGAARTVLIAYTDVDLYLFGRVDIAQAQWAIDEGRGGLVHTCSRTLQELYAPGGAGTDDAPDMQRW